MKENKIITDETTVTTENKQNKVSLTKRIVLLGIPFVLFIISIVLMSAFIFKTYIESSPYFILMINASSENTTEEITMDDDEEHNIREQITPSIFTATVTTPSVSDGDIDATTPEATSKETQSDKFEVIQYHDYSQFPPIPWGDCWGTISMDSVGLQDAPLYNGDDTKILSYTNKKAVGKRYGSQFPGQGGVTVLCAHVTRAFYGLQDMQIGDIVTLDTFYGKYMYEVNEVRLFNATDPSILHEKFDEETLICYTCYPRGRSVRSKRIAIICHKISGIDWIRTTE